jgi:hypothetical protein
MPIGESLRRARSDRGLGLEEVSDATKIRVRYLRALENEDWGALPAPAYARGFLRTYASYLGLDADVLVEELRRTVGDADAGPAEERRPVPPPGGPGFPSRGILVAAGAVVAVLAVLFVIGQLGDSGGDKTTGAQSAHPTHRRHHKRARPPKPPPEPTEATIEIKPTGTVWVCLEDLSGKRLVDGEILTAGDTQGPFKAAGFQLGLGNGEAQVTANGKPLEIPSSPNPLAFHVGPGSAGSIGAAKRPTCA